MLELSKSKDDLHDLVKSSYLMPMVSQLGQHMLHELLLLVLLADQVDISQYLVMDEMDSMLHDSSKHEYTCESEQLLQDTVSMSREHFVIPEMQL